MAARRLMRPQFYDKLTCTFCGSSGLWPYVSFVRPDGEIVSKRHQDVAAIIITDSDVPFNGSADVVTKGNLRHDISCPRCYRLGEKPVDNGAGRIGFPYRNVAYFDDLLFAEIRPSGDMNVHETFRHACDRLKYVFGKSLEEMSSTIGDTLINRYELTYRPIDDREAEKVVYKLRFESFVDDGLGVTQGLSCPDNGLIRTYFRMKRIVDNGTPYSMPLHATEVSSVDKIFLLHRVMEYYTNFAMVLDDITTLPRGAAA